MTSDGEFRVPEQDVTSVDVATAAQPGALPPPVIPSIPPTPPTPPPVDLERTPGAVVAAAAFGVVAAPLLLVYAGLFVLRFFLKPGVQPDVTSSWTGEGLVGIVALVAALVLLALVVRAVAGRAQGAFVVAQLVVAAGCGYLLSDSSSGGTRVSLLVGVVALLAVVLVLLPASRRWFAAHRAAAAAERG